MKLLRFTLLLISFGFYIQTSLAFKLSIEIGKKEEFSLQSQTFVFGHSFRERKAIDSTFSDNSILFDFDNNLPHGLYSIMIYTDMKDIEGKYQRVGFDIIVSGKDISFIIPIKNDHTFGMVEGVSGENAAYYRHFNHGYLQAERLKALDAAIQDYPEGDSFYPKLLEQADNIRQDHMRASRSIGDGNLYPMADFYFQIQKAVERKSLEDIDFSHPWLKQSQFIPLIIFEYLSAEAEENTSGASYQILNSKLSDVFSKLEADTEVYVIMLNDLVGYYERVGRQEAVVYLNDNFLLPAVCENPTMSNSIAEKNKNMKRVLIGQPAPNITFQESFTFDNLYQVPGDYFLLLFWETNCPHCQELTDELSTFFNARNNGAFKVVAFAMDTIEAEYNQYVLPKNFAWHDVTDFSGWDGEVATTYSVIATPSMFLLDKNKKIVAKPRNISQLKEFLTFAGQ